MSGFASKGLVILNVGIDILMTAGEKDDFDETLEQAINQVLTSKKKLTKEEGEKIDGPVKDKFRKFVILA